MNTSLKDYLALFFAVIISLILIYSNDNFQLKTLRTWVFELTGQIQKQISVVTQYHKVYERNLVLQQRNTALALQLFQAKDAVLENTRLREILKIPPKNDYKVVVATVIGPGLNRTISTLLIDRGTRHGININDPVITPAGLVGKILTVSTNYSQVHLLYDRHFRASGRVQRSRIAGIVRWEAGEFCLFDSIPKRADVAVGDTVVTSGFSTIFPKGIPVGTIVEIRNDSRGIFKRIKLKPAADLLKLEELLVLVNINPELSADK